MVSFLPVYEPGVGPKYPDKTDSPAAQEAARQKIALAAGSRFIRDLTQLANKPEEAVNIADGPDFEESLLSVQIREAVTAAGQDYDTEMETLVRGGNRPEWSLKAEFYLAKMVRNVPDGLRERATDAIKGDERDFNATQCVKWARDFFGKEVSLTAWADMTALLLDFAFVRQGIDDDYHLHRALKTHDEAYETKEPKALPPASDAVLTAAEVRAYVKATGTSADAVEGLWKIVGGKRATFDEAVAKFLQDNGRAKFQNAAESEIENEIIFTSMLESDADRAQVTTELQQLQNIWDTAPDVADFFSTIGSQAKPEKDSDVLMGYLMGKKVVTSGTNGVNLRDEGNGVWQVNVPSVWGKQRWQTVGTKKEATALGERVLREHRESKALVAASPTPSSESATETLARLSLERFKNATFDEGAPLQVAGEDPINEPHVNAIMRVADTAHEVAALMERKTQATMGTKIKWGGMALCATMMLITGNPMYLAFMGVAYVMGWALVDKAGIERNMGNIDKSIEDKRLKELTSAERWFDD